MRTRILAPLLLLSLSGPVAAQTITASLEGLVHDPTGAMIAGAQVTVVNTATNVETHLTTGDTGQFLALSLSPGTYSIAIEAAGFKKVEESGIVLQVNQAARLEFKMELGATSEKVEVTGQAPLIDPSTSALGQVVDNRSISNLPLNERNSWSLVFLAPGVEGSVGDKYNNVNISINGGRPGSAAILVDGTPSSTPLSNPIQGFTVLPSVDAVQEFKVQTDNYSAEFGRSGSGVINLIYKSGTNDLHGSAFEFLRNSDMDANDFFSNRNGIPLQSFKRSQFGGTAGGPVYLPRLYNGRDKTFFFFSYEGLRQTTPANLNATVPTALQRDGDFSQTLNASGGLINIYDPTTTTPSGSGFVRQVFPGNAIPTSRFDPVSRNVMKYYPLPNEPGNLYTNANNYYVASTGSTVMDQFDVKMDENINAQNRFFVRFSHRNFDPQPPDYFPAEIRVAQGNTNTVDKFNNAALEYTYNPSATLLFSLHYGLARTAEHTIPRSLGFDPVQLGMPSYMDQANDIMFPQFSPAGYRALGNGGASQVQSNAWYTHSVELNNMKVFSKHLLKFGFDGRLSYVNVLNPGKNPDGGFSFPKSFTQGPNPNKASNTAGDGFAAFLLGVGNGSLALNSKDAATTSPYYAWYVADDWKVTKRLTLNIGLRYALDVPFSERYNRANLFDPTIASPLAGPAGLPGLQGGLLFLGTGGQSSQSFATDLRNWDPRFGFAYQLSGTTVVRGGFGIFHAPSYREAAATFGSAGFSSTTSFVSAADGITPTDYLRNPFPQGLVPTPGNAAGLLTAIGTDIDAQLRGDDTVPYSENWSLNLQHQFPGSVLVEAGYVGMHALHLNFASYPMDSLRPEQLTLGTQLQQMVPNPFYGLITIGPMSAATVPYGSLVAPFPQFTSVSLDYPSGAESIYHSFQLKAEKRLSSGLSFLVSYTAQKLIDNASIIKNVGSDAAIQNIYDLRSERSVSANDISQMLVISYVYELPFGRGRRLGGNWNRAVDGFLGGWQVNGITTFQTGLPLVMTTQNTSHAGNDTLRPNNDGQSAKLGGPVESRLNEYFDTSVFSQPAPFTLGNTGRTLPDVRGPGTRNFDFSLFKNFELRERLSVQLRGEAFNVMNTVRFADPNQNLSNVQFGIISSQANDPRQLQLALKLLF